MGRTAAKAAKAGTPAKAGMPAKAAKAAKLASPARAPAVPGAHAAAGFDAVAPAFASDREVSLGKMFGSSGLKVSGKVFAMVVRGQLVVKLPRTRVDELLGSRAGVPFDPGHGRLMKEWVSVPPGKAPWSALAREAHRFVKGGGR